MKEILVLRPTKHSRHHLPYPVFISRIAACHELPEFPNDKFYTVRPWQEGDLDYDSEPERTLLRRRREARRRARQAAPSEGQPYKPTTSNSGLP
ncbi:hypothetical protein PIB30_052835 [Stylosanthes scabra]|uniref:Uncharacterized protein n=1 Tax=Stylosanthes scabra TaxID=79078 RepID=A0ABU6QHY2_9FABA|nr:hypothetical protein [Stylosanthes scabra]